MENSIFKTDYDHVMNNEQNEIDTKSIQIQESIATNKECIIRNIGNGNFELLFYNPEDLGPKNCNKSTSNLKQSNSKIDNKTYKLHNEKSVKKKRSNKLPLPAATANYQCTKCKQGYNDPELFRKHLKKHDNDKQFKCNKCHNGFNTETNLKIHMVVIHSEIVYNEAGLIICSICKVRFHRKASLKSHIIIHQTDEVFEEYENDVREMHSLITKQLPNNSPMICRYCKLDFVSATEFKDHLRKHIEIKKKLFNNKRRKNGNTQHRNREKLRKCRYCEKLFPKSCLLIRHERIHTGEKPFTCQICLKTFSQKSTLQGHLYSHTGVKPHSCQLCPAKFAQKGNLRCHIERTHMASQEDGKSYKCSQCTCIFKRISTLNAHVTRIHLNDINPYQQQQQENGLPFVEEDSSVSTPIAAKQNPNNNQYKSVLSESTNYVKVAESQLNGKIRHYIMKRKIIGDVAWFFCNICSNQFKKPSDLIRHYRSHTNEKPYKCVLCNNSFSLKHTLENHLQVHNASTYKCLYCDHKFKSLVNLQLHLSRHNRTNPLNYICKICDMKYTNLSIAKEHVISHSNNKITNIENLIKPVVEDSLQKNAVFLKPIPRKSPAKKSHISNRPHECNICHKRFAIVERLKRHRQIHGGEMKFKCTFCPKSFMRRHRLNEHLNYHQEIKNYQCNICNKGFVTASLLKRHINNKHEHFNLYVCEYCNKDTFRSIFVLKNHIRDVHNVIVEDDIEDKKDPVKQQPETAESHEDNLKKINLIQNVSSSSPAGTIAKNEQKPQSQEQHEQYLYINFDESINYNENNEIIGFNEDIFPPLKLPNEYFTDVTDCTNLFNLLDSTNTPISPTTISIKSNNNILDPNLIMNSPTTSSATAELLIAPPLNLLSTNNDLSVENNSLNNNNAVGGIVQDLIDNTYPKIIMPENLSDIVVDSFPTSFTDFPTSLLPSGTFNSSEHHGNETITLNKSENTDNSQILICINCHKIYSDMLLFQNHICTLNKANMDSESQVSESSNIFLTPNGHVISLPFNYSDKAKDVDVEILRNENEEKKNNTPIEESNYKKDEKSKEEQTKKGSNLNRKCSYCFKQFTRPSDLVRHIRTHTGEKPFRCHHCDKRFSLKGTLMSHLKLHSSGIEKCNNKKKRNINTDENSHKCNFCEKRFHNNSAKQIHEKKIHSDKESHKNNVFESLDSAIKSLTTNMKDKKEIIIQIDPIKKLQNITPSADCKENDFIDGINKETQNPLTVKKINEKTTNIDDSTVYYDYKLLEDDNFYWDTNNMKKLDLTQDLNFDDLIVIGNPVIDELPLSPPLITMENANHETKSSQKLKKEIKKAQCGMCKKLYSSRQVLKKHMKNLHMKSAVSMCEICDIGFDHIESLNQHKKTTHNMFRPHSCQYCNNSFMDESNLKSHIERLHRQSLLVQKPSENISMELKLLFDNVLI